MTRWTVPLAAFLTILGPASANAQTAGAASGPAQPSPAQPSPAQPSAAQKAATQSAPWRPAKGHRHQPVDTVFGQWLNAINANDTAAIKSFYARHLEDPDAFEGLDVAEETCGLDPVRVESQTALTTDILLVDRCFPQLRRLTIEMTAATDPRLKTFKLRPFSLSDQGVIDAITDAAGRMAAHDNFAGSIIIAHGNAKPWEQSWGTLSKTDPTPITADTPMFLASAGKMFTAVAVLQLVQAGKIDLDAPMGRYLTDYPNREMAKVTVRQLLNHRGGTGDVGILAREESANRAKVRTIDDIIALNGARGPAFPPGSKEDYSNYGFVLLGAIVQKVSGEDYYDYITRHIFRPAGMTNAGYPDKDHLRNVAIGYTSYFGAEPTLSSNVEVLPWRGMPAGGGVASANDMLKFFEALRSGKILSPAMLKMATVPSDTPWYGMGFIVNKPPHPSWGHGGGSYGMSVGAHYRPDDSSMIVCLATRDRACDRIFDIYFYRSFGLSK